MMSQSTCDRRTQGARRNRRPWQYRNRPAGKAAPLGLRRRRLHGGCRRVGGSAASPRPWGGGLRQRSGLAAAPRPAARARFRGHLRQRACDQRRALRRGRQATIPIVAAVSRVTDVPYAEIVASVSSRSAGPGTRANIDEFTETTSQAVVEVGGAERGKAIIILNPVEPPMIMRDTVFCAIPADTDRDAVMQSIHQMVRDVQQYVPGYALRADPQFDEPRESWSGCARVAVFLEVEGNGAYLPPYAANLAIMPP